MAAMCYIAVVRAVHNYVHSMGGKSQAPKTPGSLHVLYVWVTLDLKGRLWITQEGGGGA